MKQQQFFLDQSEMEEGFFENARLIAVHSELAGYQLIHRINRYLDYEFRADPEHNLKMKFSAKEVWGTERYGDAIIEFNFYTNIMPPCITEMYFYENVSDGYHLLPQLRFYNYLILIYHSDMLLYDDDILDILESIQEIKAIKEVDIAALEGKESLMF